MRNPPDLLKKSSKDLIKDSKVLVSRVGKSFDGFTQKIGSDTVLSNLAFAPQLKDEMEPPDEASLERLSCKSARVGATALLLRDRTLRRSPLKRTSA